MRSSTLHRALYVVDGGVGGSVDDEDSFDLESILNLVEEAGNPIRSFVRSLGRSLVRSLVRSFHS